MAKHFTLAERIEAYIDDPDQTSPEQRDAIRSRARLTVVRACPGSGKTRLFATRFAREVANWTDNLSGVAALSFTNVAQQEVANRVDQFGTPAGYPHFVGTIDSFLFRYVVSRFAHRTVRFDGIRIGGESEFGIQTESIQFGNVTRERAPLSAFRLEPERDGAVVYVQPTWQSNWQRVADISIAHMIKNKKRAAWQVGECTFNDICFIAWAVLRDHKICDIVAKRFPVILIDEFQDTKPLHEECFKFLFSSKHFAHGMVVGDPDQCIMEFVGARPSLFDDIEKVPGAVGMRLTRCFRSHIGITNIVSLLQRDGQAIKPGRQVDEFSKTILVTHSFTPQKIDYSQVLAGFGKFATEIPLRRYEMAIVTWKTGDANKLRGVQGNACPLDGTVIQEIYNGLQQFNRGSFVGYYQAIEKAFSYCVFETIKPSDSHFEAAELDRYRWKRIVWKIAIESCLPDQSDTVESWLARIRSRFENESRVILTKTVSFGNKLPAKPAKVIALPLAQFLKSGSAVDFVVENIHQVKGKEFDSVCLFVPKPPANQPQAIASWFGFMNNQGNPIPEPAESGEARRVAYVAMTRAKRQLMVMIPETWREELCQHAQGKNFLALFNEERTLAEFVQI
jgi:DNA helicase-2/ATP-dependent DNA helicase PcrA